MSNPIIHLDRSVWREMRIGQETDRSKGYVQMFVLLLCLLSVDCEIKVLRVFFCPYSHIYLLK